MRPIAILLLAIAIGAGVGICVANDVRAEPSLRYVTVKSGDWLRVKGQHLECNVAVDSFYCIEVGGFPRLSFLATTTGGARGKGLFYIYRNGAPADYSSPTGPVAQADRRK